MMGERFLRLSDAVEWDDIRIVYERMKGRQLLKLQAKPGTIAGHLLCIAAFGRAQRRTGAWFGAINLLRDYADWKGVEYETLCGAVVKHWRSCGHWGGTAPGIVEVLSRI